MVTRVEPILSCSENQERGLFSFFLCSLEFMPPFFSPYRVNVNPQTAMARGCSFWSSCCCTYQHNVPVNPQLGGHSLMTCNHGGASHSLKALPAAGRRLWENIRDRKGGKQSVIQCAPTQLFKIPLTGFQSEIQVTRRRLPWHVSGRYLDGDWQLVIQRSNWTRWPHKWKASALSQRERKWLLGLLSSFPQQWPTNWHFTGAPLANGFCCSYN